MGDDLSLLSVALRLSPVLLGVAVWSVTAGLAVASHRGSPPGRAVLVSALVPVVGPLALLVRESVVAARRRRASGPAQPVSPPDVVAAPVAPGRAHVDDTEWFPQGPPSSLVPVGQPVGVAGQPTERWFEPVPVAVPERAEELSEQDRFAPGAEGRRAAEVRLPLLLCLVPAVPAALAFLALFASWGAVRARVDVMIPVVGATPATAVPDLLSVIAFLAGGLLTAWRPRASWALLVGTAGLACLSVGVVAHTVLAVSDLLVERVRRMSGLARLPVEASVEAGDAIPILVSAGAIGLLWGAACMVALDRARRRARAED